MTIVRLLAVSLFVVAASACSGPVYRLPAPAPIEEQRDVSLDRVEERARDSDRYNAARRAILELYDALGNERWDDATALLTQETRVLLAGGGTQDPSATLASGTLRIDDVEYAFDAVELLLVPGVREFNDALSDVEDVETDRRKVVHLTDASGDVRSVIVLFEADAWRIHLPGLPRDRVTSSRS